MIDPALNPSFPCCPHCGRWERVLSMHEITVGPVEGDGTVCGYCGTISTYDRNLKLIVADEEADRRMLRDMPDAHGCLHDMQMTTRTTLRVSEEIAELQRSWKPGAGRLGEQG